jgi:endonuclease G, mitochondrial
MKKPLTLLLLLTSFLYAHTWHHWHLHDYDHYNYHKEYRSKAPVNYNYHPPKNNTVLKKKIFKHLHCDQILSNKVIDSCYNYNLKSTMAVAYVVDGSVVNLNNIKKRPRWSIDRRIPKRYRGNSKDYSHSGYDRGHMAADASFDAYENILKQVYDININIVPQAPMVNRKTWLKAEKYERHVAVKLGYVDIIDVPLFNDHPKRIGRDRIAVPSGFYKIIYNKEKRFERCFYYKNDLHVDWRADRLRDHVVDCRVVFARLI